MYVCIYRYVYVIATRIPLYSEVSRCRITGGSVYDLKKEQFTKFQMFLNNNSKNDYIIFKRNVHTRIQLHANNIHHFLRKLFY